MKGRPPKPTEQRLLEGNPGNRPIPAVVNIGGKPVIADKPPASLDAYGKRAWKDLVPLLIEGNVLDRVDTHVLTTVCNTVSRLERIRRAINKDGLTTEGSKGQLVAHPLLTHEANLTTLLLRLAEQFGMTPSARARLGLMQVEGASMTRQLARDLAADEEDELFMANARAFDVESTATDLTGAPGTGTAADAAAPPAADPDGAAG